VGVVNIETSHASALSDEKLIELFEVLSPTVTLLGIIASEAPLNLNL
jgi:hypothetical protein